MPDIASLRAEIATALATVAAFRGNADGLWQDTTNLPAFLIKPLDSDVMTLDMSSWFERFEVTIVVSMAGGLARGQKALDALLDDVVSALRTGLEGRMTSLRRQDYDVIEIGGVEYTGAVYRLEMIG